MTLATAFGQVLREVRRGKRVSQESLAHQAGLDVSTISLFERGLRKPSLHSVFLISRVLEISPDDLIAQVQSLDPDIQLPR